MSASCAFLGADWLTFWARWVRELSLAERETVLSHLQPARSSAERRPARLVVLSRAIKLHRFASVVTVARSCGHPTCHIQFNGIRRQYLIRNKNA